MKTNVGYEKDNAPENVAILRHQENLDAGKSSPGMMWKLGGFYGFIQAGGCFIAGVFI